MLLSERIDVFFNSLIAKTEHQNELLIGKCQSDISFDKHAGAYSDVIERWKMD